MSNNDDCINYPVKHGAIQFLKMVFGRFCMTLEDSDKGRKQSCTWGLWLPLGMGL